VLDPSSVSLLPSPPCKRSFRPVTAGACPRRPKSDFLSLGTLTGTTVPDLEGDICEMRLSKVSRSDAWMKANYNNLMNVSGFLTWGSIQSLASEPDGPVIMLW